MNEEVELDKNLLPSQENGEIKTPFDDNLAQMSGAVLNRIEGYEGYQVRPEDQNPEEPDVGA